MCWGCEHCGRCHHHDDGVEDCVFFGRERQFPHGVRRGMERLVAEWRALPPEHPFASMSLREYVGMTWDEYRVWLEGCGN